MILNRIEKIVVYTLLFVLAFGCTTETKIDYQLHRASVDMSKAIRQFQLADNAFYEDREEATVDHLKRGLNLFQTALNHLSQAEADAVNGADKEIENGNNELQKSLEEYANGNDENAEKHYNEALDYYDKALDLLDLV